MGMSNEMWTQVDDYIAERFAVEDEALTAALADSDAAGLPAIAISAAQGSLLNVLARTVGARSILEIGTLGGYSTIWLARALPEDGRVVTLEASPRHAEVAQGNLERAGVVDKVEIRIGPAQETLPALIAEGVGPFDFIFIDADKEGYSAYLSWTLELAQPGTLIVADNVIRDGRILDATSDDANAQGARRFNDLLAAESRVNATLLQTVGSKGYDGFALAVVK